MLFLGRFSIIGFGSSTEGILTAFVRSAVAEVECDSRSVLSFQIRKMAFAPFEEGGKARKMSKKLPNAVAVALTALLLLTSIDAQVVLNEVLYDPAGVNTGQQAV